MSFQIKSVLKFGTFQIFICFMVCVCYAPAAHASQYGYLKMEETGPVCVVTSPPQVQVTIKEEPLKFIMDKNTRQLSLIGRGLQGHINVENPNDTLGLYAPRVKVQAELDYDLSSDSLIPFMGKHKCIFYEKVHVIIHMAPEIYVSSNIKPNYSRCLAHVKKHELQHHEGMVESVKRLQYFYKMEFDKLFKVIPPPQPIDNTTSRAQVEEIMLAPFPEIAEEGLRKMGVFMNYHSDNFVHADGNKLRDMKECRYVRF
jgi:hypothetical protein